MLLHRILTAIPLAIIVIWMVFYQPTSIFVYLLFLVGLISGYEWARLGGLVPVAAKAAYAIAVTLIAWVVINAFYQQAYLFVVVATMVWFLIAFYMKSLSPKAASTVLAPAKLVLGLIIIPMAVVAMTMIHAVDRGPEWLFYGLLLVWIADISAYFSGKKFGRIKLAPTISPGKTREGLYGALLATTLYTVVASVYFGLGVKPASLLLMLSIVLTLISVVGDLYLSFLKRESGLKDSGVILPGHGGMLDRIDSLLAAMPLLFTGIHWLSLNGKM